MSDLERRADRIEDALGAAGDEGCSECRGQYRIIIDWPGRDPKELRCVICGRVLPDHPNPPRIVWPEGM